MTRQGADLRGKSAGTKAGRLLNGFTFQRAGLLANPGFVQSSKIVSFNCGLHHTSPKSPPKRDRAITKAEPVSPLSPTANQSCGPAARLSGIFGYFCFQDKSDSPISLRSKRGETVFSGFCASKTAINQASAEKTPRRRQALPPYAGSCHSPVWSQRSSACSQGWMSMFSAASQSSL